MLAVRGQCDRAYVIAAAERPRNPNDEWRSNGEVRTSTKRAFSFTIPSSHNAVMLSEAKHLRLFPLGADRTNNDQRFFAKPVLSEAEGLRMTVSKLLRYSSIR